MAKYINLRNGFQMFLTWYPMKANMYFEKNVYTYMGLCVYINIFFKKKTYIYILMIYYDCCISSLGL